jgi:hypothetical protein
MWLYFSIYSRYMNQNNLIHKIRNLSSTKIILSLVFVLFSFATIPVAHATTVVQVSGTFTFTVTSMTITHLADGNTFIAYTYFETQSGTISASGSGTGSLIIHPDGTIKAMDAGTNTGTIAGSAIGTFTRLGIGTGTFASNSGTLLISGGTGGLEGVHGLIHWSSPTGNGGTYSGQVEFTP